MSIQAKPDGNVPHIGPRSRYNIVGSSARWVYHVMAAATALNGGAPATAGVGDPNDLDPVVKPGRAEYGFSDDKLVTGGLFTHLGKVGLAMTIEDSVLPGNPEVTLVDSEGTLIRTLAASGISLDGFPIRLAPGEYIKAVGGTGGSNFGFLVRLDGVKVI